MEAPVQDPKDKWMPRYFIIFFAVIALVNGIFIYVAISTQTGIVTEQPYEKGLAFNDTLEKARLQPKLENKLSYKNGILRWQIPIENASVTAMIVRPVQAGHDFEVTFANMGNGVYEVTPETPLSGLWAAKLKATWDNKTFQTQHNFIVE